MSNSSRDNLNIINKQIEKLDDQISLISSEISSLNDSRKQVILTLLKEEKLFNNSVWKLDTDSIRFNCVILTSLLDYDPQVKNQSYKLVELCFTNGMHHDNFLINDKIEFRLDDYELTLRFNHVDDFLEFKKENNLVVYFGDVESLTKKLKDQLASVDKLVQSLSK